MPKPKCTVDGCNNEQHSKLFCFAHYRRNQRKGSPEADKPIRSVTGDTVRLPPVRVPPEVDELVKMFATAEDVSKYEIVRRIIMDWYNRAAVKPNNYSRST